MTDPQNTARLRTAYRDLALDWQAEAGSPARAERTFHRLRALHDQLRESEDGREAIIELLDDPVTVARWMAASGVPGWAPGLPAPWMERIESPTVPNEPPQDRATDPTAPATARSRRACEGA
ncbi:hypothetical protein [Cellulomonas soli]|uniref:Uncharacterized protein n=1 Tax=Cellulomonas soli TaxID=931535 RepID=A0A512P9D1_9CELL|nr:hypothetical protein [Cellulomonas soli]NYI60294.1 hypothetical protein [Cellulomonas soli]GEP67805.1 hypothetical protein CSO01_05200 [Cellulomonas soli]